MQNPVVLSTNETAITIVKTILENNRICIGLIIECSLMKTLLGASFVDPLNAAYSTPKGS
jgi:hypothetical protein